ncbi:hypothetical protein LIER_41629 [Lithospermum erythrorhizon]|uniref:Uncharacterized protein n=1 Tax=Lithospermum erythrorhizon TaxID=34254 RepID=A0AAV3RG03_LITER
MDPVAVALENGILDKDSVFWVYLLIWGAVNCESAHLGEIRPGGLRGNHFPRHRFCNETLVIWRAATFCLLFGSPVVTADALLNVDPFRTTFFLGCQDSGVTSNTSSDYKVCKDL